MKQYFLLFFSLVGFSAFGTKIYNIVNSGAVGNGTTVNTAAIQMAIDSCTVTGGIVEVPAGSFVTGTIILQSNVNLQIDSGATLEGSGTLSDFPAMTKSFASAFFTNQCLIYADSARNIAITGKGTINGEGSSIVWLLSTNKTKRPFGIWLVSCENVLIKDVNLQNSAYWMLHPMNCDSVAIINVTIGNHANANNDGIDVDGCNHVWITGCNIDALDDAISPKTTFNGTCSNVIIKHCTLASWSNDIRFGTESWGTIRNLIMDSCIFKLSTFSGANAAVAGINMGEENGGSMDSISISNITIVSGVATAFCIRLEDASVPYAAGAPVTYPGAINNVTVENLTGTITSNITGTIAGIPTEYIHGINLKNIALNFPGGFPAVRNSFVLPVDVDTTQEVAATMFGDTIPSYGVYAQNVKGISINNVCFTYKTPDKRPILYFANVLSSAGNPLDTSAFTTISGGADTRCIDSSVLDINEVEAQREKINVYPNPSKGIFNFALTSGMKQFQYAIEVFDVFGMKLPLVLTFSSTGAGKTASLDMSNYNAGIYFYRILTESGSVAASGKLVVE